MKTDDFLDMLATGVEPVDHWTLARRFSLAVLIGLLAATLLVIGLLGIRPDLAQVAATPLFWAKVALPSALIVGALSMVTRLSRPGVTAGPGKWLVGATLAAVWLGTAVVLVVAAPGSRAAVILGATWKVCPLLITLLSAPGFVAIFWALRGMAPTRPVWAGAAGGLLSGALATLAYCLHCPEMEVPFWGVWYVTGMLLPTVLGALMGPRWLRW